MDYYGWLGLRNFIYSILVLLLLWFCFIRRKIITILCVVRGVRLGFDKDSYRIGFYVNFIIIMSDWPLLCSSFWIRSWWKSMLFHFISYTYDIPIASQVKWFVILGENFYPISHHILASSSSFSSSSSERSSHLNLILYGWIYV